MKRIHYIVGGSILALLLSSNVYIYFLYIGVLNVQQSFFSLRENIGGKIFALELQKENRNNEMILDGIKLETDAIVTKVNGVDDKLCNIVDGNKLILRYSELNCNTCIEAQIVNLNRYADSIGMHNILLFTTYHNHSYMKRFKKMNKIKFEIYNVSAELDSALTDIGLPYFFVLTPCDNRVQSMYIPQKELPS